MRSALNTSVLLGSLFILGCGEESPTPAASNSPLGNGGSGGALPTQTTTGNAGGTAPVASPSGTPTQPGPTQPSPTQPAPSATPTLGPSTGPAPSTSTPTPGAGGTPNPSPTPTVPNPVPSAAGGSGGSGGSGEPSSTGGAGGDTSSPEPDSPSQATPSQGCSSGGGGSNPSANVSNAIVTFPDGYDGTTPMPMIFGFHGAGRDNTQFRTVDARTQGHELEQNYVMVYLKSSGNDWTGDLNGNKSRFSTTYDTMVDQYCIDTSRVFAIGHSSGAQFITNLVCGGESRLRALGPVASSRYCQSHGAVATLYIQGSNDRERGGSNGKDVVDVIVAANGCGSSTPYEVSGCSSGGTQVNPGCVQYQDCTQDTYWCSHNDPNYSNTNHGWPCFANDTLFDFFESQH